MNLPPVPDRIARAARARIEQATTQRVQVESATAKARLESIQDPGDTAGSPPLIQAEPDHQRKIRRLQAVAGVSLGQAEELIEGADPAKMLAGDNLLGAERILGKTVDFVGVSFLDYARAATGCIGRIIFSDGRPQGSGFLISDRLFLTNNHVIESAEAAVDFLVEFNYELDVHGRARTVTRFALAPGDFFVTEPQDDLDYTLVALGARDVGPGQLADFGFCPLFDSDDKHVLGEYVNVVQHPDGDYKQVVLRENKLVSRLGRVLHYEADTEPGSSGSPVFNDQWEAVALHHWGGPHLETQTADGQPVPTSVNEGIRISAIVDSLRSWRPNLTPAQQALLDQALNAGFRYPSRVDAVAAVASPPSPAVPPEPGPIPQREAGADGSQSLGEASDAATTSPPLRKDNAMQPSRPAPAPAAGASSFQHRINEDGSVTVTIPVEISIRIPGLGTTAAPATSARPGAAEAVKPDPDFGNRSGYDPGFLSGLRVPIPVVAGAAAAQRARLLQPAAGADPFELRYEHFSIVMNKARKMPFVTAANIDGSRSRHIDRKSGKVSDDGNQGEAARRLGTDDQPEASETWYGDDRIAGDAQTAQSLYSNQQPRTFDRGHQVRREDPVWGDDETAERANADTFHFTNCCPQHWKFNEQAQYWAGIENYVLDNARAERTRVSVFTGPVFAPSDPRYRDVRVPLQFFKVIAWVEDGEPRARAFLASQAELLTNLPERAEAFDDVGKVREYLTTVQEVEEITGLDFGPLRDHDTHRPESLEAPLRPLRSQADILEA